MTADPTSYPELAAGYSIAALPLPNNPACGRVPFLADSAVETMAMHISEAPVPIAVRAPWLPPAFGRLVHAMLAKQAAERPTAEEVCRALAAMRASPEVANASPATPSPATVAVPPPARRRGIAIAGAAVLALVIGGGVLAVVGARARSPARGAAIGSPTGARAQVAGTASPDAGAQVAGTASPDAGAQVAGTAPPDAPVPVTPAAPDAGARAVRAVVRAPRRASTGTLEIRVVGGSHATLRVDGKRVGRDHVRIAVPPGPHVVRAETDDGRWAQVSETVHAGKAASVPLHPQTQGDHAFDPFAEHR